MDKLPIADIPIEKQDFSDPGQKILEEAALTGKTIYIDFYGHGVGERFKVSKTEGGYKLEKPDA